MADIAILVAEEYERRIKNCRRMKLKVEERGAVDQFEGLNPSLVSSSVSSFAETVMKKKMMRENKKLEVVKWVLEPKSPLSVAASDGFFSA
ncbi:RING-CH-type domain-containing protein [Psidium guajava]|nr:RING-CH-type domain-containing protein [Psidium guajava]